MKDPENQNINKAEQGLQIVNPGSTSVQVYEEKGKIFVPHSAHEKLVKERAYYDSPANPGRNLRINDQAMSQSSAKNYIKTTSAFHHSDEFVDNNSKSTI